MNPFSWTKAAAKALSKKAFQDGINEGVAEAAQEFAARLEGLSIDLPALEDDKPAKRGGKKAE